MLGVVLMLVAALLNATASVLQRCAAKAEPASAGFTWRMFAGLARRPVWFLGVVTMLAGFLLHAVAIAVARIALVQPLVGGREILPARGRVGSPLADIRVPR